MPVKIAVFASHGGSNMQSVIDNIESGRLDAEIVMVISNNSKAKALDRARTHDLPWRHLSGATHPGDGELDETICAALRDSGAELVLLAGYMKKIGEKTLAAFQGRILNIHPALLPKHGGRGMYGIHPHESVLATGDTESGATVHLVDAHYDTGPVIRQRRVPVLDGDTPQTLQQRVLAEEHQIYSEVVADICAGRLALPFVPDRADA